ncbi:pre-mRNA processing factor 3-domain-containing protein [Dichotomocladium elegans]|nr:pre-mRNA processing factor 3-domain-containing protein [Dichotomocladium elegans]
MPDRDQTTPLEEMKARFNATFAKFQKQTAQTSTTQWTAHRSSETSSSAHTQRPAPIPAGKLPNVPSPAARLHTQLSLDAIKQRREELKAQLAERNPLMPRATAKGIYVPDSEGRVGAAAIPTDGSGNFDLKAMFDSMPKRDKGAIKRAPPIKQGKIVNKLQRLKEDDKNPYLESSGALGVKTTGAVRKARPLRFVQPGKYIEMGHKERQKAQLERLKQEIAENVRKAGMQVEMDISDKALKKEPPPPVEWWDAPFLPSKVYDELDQTPVKPEELDQLVTSYVHHPIPIKPPNEPNEPAVVRSLMLTKKERKKLRRQQRAEAMKEKQDKIRLGLLPPDPPKVKISNLMQVLGNEAIQDPTKIEAKVRKEMEQRQKLHELANEQRKLTPEERRAKIMSKMNEDKKVSNEVAVFKVRNCAHPKHRYKIEMNAQQYQLSGMVIIHPKCHLVIVEGGPKSIKAYKKLMLRRIDWTDMPPPKNGSLPEQASLDAAENNRCFLVWEGQVKAKAFRKFTWRTFESEKMAREELAKWHVEHYWDAAVMPSDEELAARQPEI